MAVTLLPLPNGHYSLEFKLSDMPSVTSAIKDRYGSPAKQQYVTFTDYRFGGCRFTFHNEWDDPCLISDSTEGDGILKIIRDALDDAP